MNPMPEPCCITIDGPAGAGKSTVARRLARRLSEVSGRPFEYLDTGSMYRAVALFGYRRRVDWNVPEQLERLAVDTTIDVVAARTLLDGEDVTELVRAPEITEKTRFAADNPVIRAIMVRRQRGIAGRLLLEGRGLVTEGRDQGTVVFPDAFCKIYLTATPLERARRRLGELESRGETGELEQILDGINRRDARDEAREVGPLRKPDDAVEVVTDGMDVRQVVDALTDIVLRKIESIPR